MSSDNKTIMIKSPSDGCIAMMNIGPIVENKIKKKNLNLIEIPKVSNIEMTPFQRKIFVQRYSNYNPKTQERLELMPEECFARVATLLTQVEEHHNPMMNEREIKQFAYRFYNVMLNGEFYPAGRTLSNMGVVGRKVVPNCIVLHPTDSLFGKHSIMETFNEEVKLQRAGCGIGTPLHLLRPHNQNCVGSGATASGPVSFMIAKGTMFRVIKQQSRHGANMGMMKGTHPELLEFIRCKGKNGFLTTYNISVLFTDNFMEQATLWSHKDYENPWMCEFNGKKQLPFFIVHEEDLTRDSEYKVINTTWGNSKNLLSLSVGSHYVPEWTASRILHEFAKQSWTNGEPGCAFYDTINNLNPLPGLGTIEASNPCGEQFLHDGDVCNLGSVNLNAFRTTDKNGKRTVDYDRIKEVGKTACRMLDNVIDITDIPSERVAITIKKNRRVGVGIMGLADLLFYLRLPYNSQEGRDVARKCLQMIQEGTEEETKQLAKERGSFPNFSLSVFSKQNDGDNIPRRNSALTNVPPTGTTGGFAGVSGGCEPYFRLSYTYRNVLAINGKQGIPIRKAMIESLRKTKYKKDNKYAKAMENGLELSDICVVGLRPELIEMMKEECPSVLENKLLMEKIHKTGSVQCIDEVPESIKKVFVTSDDISVEDHILMQASLQEVCDNAISKTLNMKNSVTVDDVKNAYIKAWKLKIKGCTIYRDGSRSIQVLNSNNSSSSSSSNNNNLTINSEQIIKFNELTVEEYKKISNDKSKIYSSFESNGKSDKFLISLTREELAFIQLMKETHGYKLNYTQTSPIRLLNIKTKNNNPNNKQLSYSDDGVGLCVRGGNCE